MPVSSGASKVQGSRAGRSPVQQVRKMPEGVQVPLAQKPAQAPPQASAQYEARKELDRRTPTATLAQILAAPGCTTAATGRQTSAALA